MIEPSNKVSSNQKQLFLSDLSFKIFKLRILNCLTIYKLIIITIFLYENGLRLHSHLRGYESKLYLNN